MRFRIAAASLAAMAVAAVADPATVTVDCTQKLAFEPFWNSAGYTPATFALRPDEFENMAFIGSSVGRGVKQIRIHFLLDLVVVTAFQANPNYPSGYHLTYDWSLLDTAMDWLVANQLSPGFELMGSPAGFPQIPESFYQPSDGNGSIEPAQTLAMFRQLVADLLVHYGKRYSVQEVSAWNMESWNEPSCGWNWPKGLTTNTTFFTAYQSYWDAAAAGVSDAEKVFGAGTHFIFGGPAECKISPITQWVMTHYVNGTNMFTGEPGRLDFISVHFKGYENAAGTVSQAQAFFQQIREGFPGNPRNLWNVPFYNDEADPEVGWNKVLDWRGDARYPAMQAKEVNQHLVSCLDTPMSENNPIGLISFDAAMINLDGYTGFGQRTLTARFTAGGPVNNSLPGVPFATVRKQGLHFYTLASKLGSGALQGTQRCAISGTALANTTNSLNASFGAIATSTTPSSGGAGGVPIPAQVAIMLYNSADIANTTGTAGQDQLSVTVNFANTLFPSGSQVLATRWTLDNSVSVEGTWVTQGSPQTPSPQQLQQLWDSARMQLSGQYTLTAGANGALSLPVFALNLPVVTVWQIVATTGTPGFPAPPPAPTNLRAFVKDPAMSLLDAPTQREVLIRWNCDSTAPGQAPVVSPATMTYVVQVSPNGSPTGPWYNVSGDPSTQGQYPDYSCMAIHAASTTQPTSLLYRALAIDVLGQSSPVSATTSPASWPWPTDMRQSVKGLLEKAYRAGDVQMSS